MPQNFFCCPIFHTRLTLLVDISVVGIFIIHWSPAASFRKNVITATCNFVYVSNESFQLFNHWRNENQYQHTYKLEEISRKYYVKELFSPIVQGYHFHRQAWSMNTYWMSNTGKFEAALTTEATYYLYVYIIVIT